jgi:hypothetical protein
MQSSCSCVWLAGVTVPGRIPLVCEAQILRIRNTANTCTLYVCCAGYDYINRAETTAAEFFAENGYDTAHFGKW